MSGLPVTVRLLDPPLHEFLPKADKDIEEVARSLNLSAKEVKDRISELHEENPMFCLLYTSPSPRDLSTSRMPSSA